MSDESQSALYNTLCRLFLFEEASGAPLAMYKIVVFDQHIKDTFAQLVDDYVSKYKKINKLRALGDRLQHGEFFLVLLDRELNSGGKASADLKLASLNFPKIPSHELINKFDYLYGKTLNDYERYSAGEHSYSVGPNAKEIRICRYCGKTGKEHFRKKAHAISEALGNKQIITNFLDGNLDRVYKFTSNLPEKQKAPKPYSQ